MKRTLTQELVAWKERPGHKPLLIRGARQTGKTYLVEMFGKTHFQNLVTVNFEEMKELKKSFDQDLSPHLILRDISARLNQVIIPGKTLLFFDEIQACPNALLSLRFFKEQMPDLHIIGAGSLLEFILSDDRFSFPVGRIEYLYMRPLSFLEYLEAKEEKEALAWIKEATLQNGIGPATHSKLLEIVREYFIVGGMPESVSSFLKTQQFLGFEALHQQLLNTYESDLGKYPRSSQQKFMRLLFEAAPRLIGEHFKYAKIHPHAQSRDYLESLEVLSRTGILHQAFANSALGVPLSVQKNEKKFKLFFLDIGLLPQASATALLDTNDLISYNRGVLAEQFVGQELIAYSKPYSPSQLYYWERDKPGTQAEIDYVIEINSHMIPIEVKAGAQGRLRSLKYFMNERKSPIGLRISEAPLSLDERILSVPFYMMHEIPRLVSTL